ncbi:MAG: nucleotidyltransferase family protein [Phenylobacterium sp.]|uniref:nucleotidyltransferase family protein n=1 Tax=Phenylobacterium sp. TaxID=1871053 RepID=UPI001A6485B1|nr:nucleotidyltransferase family protein [Phenylobacterium sp.]MBL8555053.1 nucleotidyltransferase family protein [Phenylobacterium sp.]
MSDEARLEAILRRSEPLMHVLRTLAVLELPDWLIFSGAIYQRVFNDLTGRPLDYGIKDYDVAYHDASDIGYEAEDAVIRRVAAEFEPPLREMVEVRNQARVHVWFEGHFGEPYSPLSSSAEALTRFVSPVFAVGVRLDRDDRMTLHAPFGLDDLFAMRLRPNPNRLSPNFDKIAGSAKARWPEIEVLR